MADETEGAVASVQGGEGNVEPSVLDQAVEKMRGQREEAVPFSVVEENSLPKARRQVIVEVPAEEMDRRIAALFKEIQPTAHVEGFRKGKVPLKILQRRYAQAAQNDVIEKITPLIVRDYEKSKGLTLYGVPTITDYKLEDGKGAKITIEVEVKPEIDPQNYTGIELEVPETKVTPEMVERRIEELRAQNSTFEEADKELQDGDAAVLDMKVVDSKGHTVQQETDKLFENPHGELPHPVSHALFGKKAGETVEVTSTEDNKELRYTVTLKAVKEMKLPSVDDEFAKDLGYESEAALRKGVEEAIQKVIDNMNADEAFEVLTGKLVEAHEFEVPPALKQHVEREMARSDYMYLTQTGVTPPRLQGKNTRTQYQEELDRAAELRVKGFLLIDAIGRKENIKSEESDVQAALEERAQQEGRKPAAIRAALERKREWVQFEEQVRFNKIREFLLSKSKISYVEPKPEDAATEGEEAKSEA